MMQQMVQDRRDADRRAEESDRRAEDATRRAEEARKESDRRAEEFDRRAEDAARRAEEAREDAARRIEAAETRAAEDRRQADRRHADFMEQLIRNQDRASSLTSSSTRDRSDNNDKILLLKRYGDVLKNTLPKFPTSDHEICVWIDNAESVYDTCEVPLDLRSSLLLPFLNDKAKRLVCQMSEAVKADFKLFKNALIKEFKLTAAQHRQAFLVADKKADESFVQLRTRLKTLLSYYMSSRKVESLDDLTDLLIADKLKDCMPVDLRMHVLHNERNDWFHSDKLVDIADSYINNSAAYGTKSDNEIDTPNFS